MTIPKINLEPDNVYKSKLHRKAMNSYITLMIIASIGLGGYAQASDDLANQKPTIANAQTLTSQEFIQTAEIEPLKVRNESTTATDTALIRTDDNYTRVFNYISKHNKDQAESMAKACLEMASFDVCRLSLAISFKESKLGNAFTIATMNPKKGLIWQPKKSQDIVNITESDNQDLAIRYNLWGVKYSEDRGGNYMQYVDIDNGKTYFGSIVGYKSFDEAFTDHNRILTKTYSKYTNNDITKEDIAGIASRYLTGNKKSWTDVVFDQFNQI